MPRRRKHAVRHVDRAEAERRGPAGGGLRLCCQRGHHRVEKRQCHGGAKRAADERPSGQMLLGDDHGYRSFACATVVSDGSSRVRIWNNELSTTPWMMAEKR